MYYTYKKIIKTCLCIWFNFEKVIQNPLQTQHFLQNNIQCFEFVQFSFFFLSVWIRTPLVHTSISKNKTKHQFHYYNKGKKQRQIRWLIKRKEITTKKLRCKSKNVID